MVFGDVCGGIGDDAGDGDNDTGLGVDAGNTANDIFEGAVSNAYHASGTVVYLFVGDGIGLWQAYADKVNEVGHLFVCDSQGCLYALGGWRADKVYGVHPWLAKDGTYVVIASIDKE